MNLSNHENSRPCRGGYFGSTEAGVETNNSEDFRTSPALAQDDIDDAVYARPAGLTFTVMSADAPVGKRFTHGDGGRIVKSSVQMPLTGTARRRAVASLDEFDAVVASLGPADVIVHGVPNADEAAFVTQKNMHAAPPGAIARDNKHFTWSRGPALLLIDCDFPPGSPEPDAADIDRRIGQAVPGWRSAARLFRASASSHISDADTGLPLAGVAGLHAYAMVANASDIPEIGKRIFDRLLLAGEGYVRHSRSGALLVRTLADATVWQPERLDFHRGVLGPGLEQAIPRGVIFSASDAPAGTCDGMLDIDSIPALSAAEMVRVAQVRRELLSAPAVLAEQARLQGLWAAAEALKAVPDATPEELSAAAKRFADRAVAGQIFGDFRIRLDDGAEVTVDEVCAAPAIFHNRRCHDPLDDEGDARVGIILSDRTNGSGGIVIHSHLHGSRMIDLVSSLGFDDAAVGVEFEDMPIPSSNPVTYDPYDDLGDHSDTGNANLLRKFAKGDMRFVVERNHWLWWTGKHWQVDDTGSLAQTLALKVGKHYLGKAQSIARRAADASIEPAEQKKLLKVVDALKGWATTCRNKTSIANMLTIASRDARMVIRTAEMDRDPWLFGVANGVVDLRTGDLRAAGRDDVVTKRSASPFVPGAPALRWRALIDEITGAPIAGQSDAYVRRPALAGYLQRMCGYLMTGVTVEHKMFIPHGRGSNGKNVLLDIVQEVMGDYCVTVPPEALMSTRYEGDAEKPSSVAATLAGARAAISSETKEGQKLDVALVKRHTGGGFMNARLMRENSFRFAISHKLVLMTNHRPTLDHMDEAIRGRLHMIPFDRVWNRPGHPDRDPSLPDGDKGLMDTLRAEAEGVLAWLVEGAALYVRDGLEPPAEVTKATRDYFATEDDFGQWLESMERCEPKAGLRASELFGNYTAHCISNARRPSIATQTAFSLELKKRGTESKVQTNGTFYGLTYGGLVGSGGLF